MATVRSLNATLEANTSQFQASMAGAGKALERLTSPQHAAMMGARQLQVGLRQLADEAVGVGGPIGHLITGMTELGGIWALAAAAGIGGLILAVKEIDKPFDDLSKRLAEVNKRFREAQGPFQEYTDIINQAKAGVVAYQAALEVAPAGVGNSMQAGIQTLVAWLALKRAEGDANKIVAQAERDAASARQDTQQQYVTQAQQKYMLLGKEAGQVAALQAMWKGYDQDTQNRVAFWAREAEAKQIWLDNEAAVKKLVEAMRQYAATLGMTDLEVKRFTVEHSNMTAKQREAALAAIAEAEGAKALYEATVQLAKFQKDYYQAIDSTRASMEAQVVALRTQRDTMGMSSAQAVVYKLRLDALKIGLTDVTRGIIEQAQALANEIDALDAVQKAQEADRQLQEKAAKEQQRLWTHAVEGMQDAFVQMLLDIGRTKGAFSDLVKSILEMWERLAAQLLAQRLFQMLLGLGGGGGGGKMFVPTIGSFGAIGNAGAGMPEGQLVGRSPGGLQVVHQTINFQVSAMDGRSVTAVIQEHKETIAGVILKATQQSSQYRAALGRG